MISKNYLAHSKILIALECLINPEHFEYVSFFGQETLHLACMVKGDGVSFLYQGMKSCCAKDLRVLLAVIFSLLDDVAGGESGGYIM